MNKTIIYILFPAFVLLFSIQGNAQISISAEQESTFHYTYKNKELADEDPMYNLIPVDINLCISADGLYYIRLGNDYIARGGLIKGIKINNNKIIDKFFLADNKDGAINALKQLVNSITKIGKDAYLVIKDFKGKEFYFTNIKSKNQSYIIDPSLPLQNELGKEFDGFGFYVDINFINGAIENSDNWK